VFRSGKEKLGGYLRDSPQKLLGKFKNMGGARAISTATSASGCVHTRDENFDLASEGGGPQSRVPPVHGPEAADLVVSFTGGGVVPAKHGRRPGRAPCCCRDVGPDAMISAFPAKFKALLGSQWKMNLRAR